MAQKRKQLKKIVRSFAEAAKPPLRHCQIHVCPLRVFPLLLVLVWSSTQGPAHGHKQSSQSWTADYFGPLSQTEAHPPPTSHDLAVGLGQ